MSYGKMNTFIDIIKPTTNTDSEGFGITTDVIIASIRAYKEERHGNKHWANMASFSNASALFRFRKIPKVTVDTTMVITCSDGRYKITSVENVAGRDMYIEVLTEKEVDIVGKSDCKNARGILD